MVLCWEWKKGTCLAMSRWRSSSRLELGDKAKKRRSRGGAVCYCLRSLLFLFEAVLFLLRPDESRRRKSEQTEGTRAGRTIRLFTFTRRISGRPSGIFTRVEPIKIEFGLPDERVLFLSDIFPTGYMAAENAEIEPGNTVGVRNCDLVAQIRIRLPLEEAPAAYKTSRDKEDGCIKLF
jgi:hypothetical protein